jgi:hypothetical protein
MIAFGYRLLVRLLYRLQACAFANGLLFLDALRLPYRNMALLRRADAGPSHIRRLAGALDTGNKDEIPPTGL